MNATQEENIKYNTERKVNMLLQRREELVQKTNHLLDEYRKREAIASELISNLQQIVLIHDTIDAMQA